MTAFNIVRMKVKPGEEKAYLDLHRNRNLNDLPGMKALNVVKTGDREYIIVGEWSGMYALAAALRRLSTALRPRGRHRRTVRSFL